MNRKYSKTKRSKIIVVLALLSLAIVAALAGVLYKPQITQLQNSLSQTPNIAQQAPAGSQPKDYPVSDGNILWDAGWETGDTSQWKLHTGLGWGNSSVEVVTDSVR